MTSVAIDYESYSEAPLVGASSVGLWSYSSDISTQVLMVAYRFDKGRYEHVDLTQEEFPKCLREALLDPHVEKWAFNAAFERVMTRNALGIDTPYENWRCTMGLANLQSFTGTLGDIGKAMGVSEDKQKDKEGGRLIKLFCGPQRITKANPLWRRDRHTDYDDWIKFCEYNIQDVRAETEIRDKLVRFEIPPEEWAYYERDQRINDEGLPVNRAFVERAGAMSERRKDELVSLMRQRTGLINPNSTGQLLPWLRERGYAFADLQKATVKKELTAHKTDHHLTVDAVWALRKRLQASRTSVRKYPAIMRRLSPDDRLRHAFQFAGAARTARWAGRGPNPHNLVRTPAALEAEDGDAAKLECCASIIESGDYSTLKLFMQEPMTALAGSIRSSFQAPEGYQFTVCDLSAIESAVAAWLSGCERLLHVFRSGLDPYKDFGVELYGKPYEEITKAERTICKPGVLGCVYQLGGGSLREGKRTGLWGYAESMGVDITEEEADRQVQLFRSTYHEIPTFWSKLDHAARMALTGKPSTVMGLLEFAMDGPYLSVRLPSGRKMYYYKPRVVVKEFAGKDGKIFTRRVVSYMGMNQVTHRWGRTYSSPGKACENIVQATARDILAVGLRRAWDTGFRLVGSVHDELVALTPLGDNRLTLERLRECMVADIDWAEGLPLGASGYQASIYRKD